MSWWQHPSEEDDAFALQRLRRRPDELIDRVVQRLATDLDVPICAVTILGDETEWILSGVGVGDGDLHRTFAFSNLPGAELIADAREHPVLGGHPWVEATPTVRTAIVVPMDQDGERIGALVAMDVVIRDFAEAELKKVRDAADMVLDLLSLRHAIHRISSSAFNRDAFARHLVHVVAGPSRRAAMCAQLAREAMTTGELDTVDTYLGYVEEQTAHAQHLVTELSRFLQASPEVELTTTDIEAAVQTSWRTVSPQHLQLNLRLEEPQMVANATHLTSALTELFRNVQMHGGEQATRVVVWSRRVDGVVNVGVVDDGPGIPPSLHADVLKPLVRGPNRQPGAIGLGLAEVVRAVTAWGGRVKVGAGADDAGLSIVFTESLQPLDAASLPPGPQRLERPQ